MSANRRSATNGLKKQVSVCVGYARSVITAGIAGIIRLPRWVAVMAALSGLFYPKHAGGWTAICVCVVTASTAVYTGTQDHAPAAAHLPSHR